MEQAKLDEMIETALAHHTAGRLTEAENLYRQILVHDPDDADALHLLGALIAQRGLGDAALALIDRAILVDPGVAEFHNNRGLILVNLGRVDQAILAHKEAVRLRPDFAEAHNNLGNALLKGGYIFEATSAFRQTIMLRPDYVNAHSNLGVALHRQNLYEEAIAEYRVALAAQPNHAEARNNLGVALRETGRMDQAIEAYRAAIAADDQFVDPHTNLGPALHDIGKPDEAIPSLRRAIELNPDYAPAHYNLALSLLQKGDYEQGWTEYEFRAYALATRRKFTTPQWNGQPLAGKTILLHGEGGFGDPIQHVRFVPVIKSRGARVFLQVQSDLVRLMTRLQGADTVLAKDDPAPACDFHSPLLSLAGKLQITTKNIPAKPYLSADPAISQKWAAKLTGEKRRRIGFAWAGAPVHHNDKNRSIPLEKFAPFSTLPGVRFFSLQKNRPVDQPINFEIVDWSADFTDFAETAGLIDNLDLIISVDTAVAHLAGAMGKPVWLLLPFVADWRWLRDRVDSPWYPTMLLFRQSAPGNWKEVIDQVTESLKAN